MDYSEVSTIIGWVAAVVSFFASWAYCIISYGFLLGLGLGWLPSIFVAGAAGLLAWLWPLWIVAGLALLAK